MFRHILAPVDGSPDAAVALDSAIDIASAEMSMIHTLFVADIKMIETIPRPATIDMSIDATPGLAFSDTEIMRERLSMQGTTTLADARLRCAAAGVDCVSEFVEGVVARVILDRAARADLIVMGRRGNGAYWAGPRLGSVLEAVVRYAPVPVWIAQAERRPFRRILVAFDGSARASAVLKAVMQLSRHQPTTVTVVTVDDGQVDRRPAWVTAQALLDLQGRPETPLLVKGHPTREILRLARTRACDLIALGACGHREFVETVFGSTVDEVLHLAISPVLIYR